MMHFGEAFGKLILLGEHAAVYGHPAVGIQLPCRIQVSFEPDESGRATFPRMKKRDAVIMDKLLIRAVDEGMNIADIHGRWGVKSDVPRAGGFGSSAGLSTAVARLLLRCDHQKYDRTVHRLANRLERMFHGNPSGIDAGIASHPGLSAWHSKPGDVPEPSILVVPPLHLIYGALPRTMGTYGSLEVIKRRQESDNGEITSILGEIGRITKAFIRLYTRLGTGKREVFLQTVELIRQSQDLLKALGLSTREFNLLLTIADESGAATGKLSGGGMGGAFFLLTPDARGQQQLFESLPERLEREGVVLAEPLRTLTLGCP